MSESVTYKFLSSFFSFSTGLKSPLPQRMGCFLSVIYVCMCERQTMLLMSCVRTRELEPPQAREGRERKHLQTGEDCMSAR